MSDRLDIVTVGETLVDLVAPDARHLANATIFQRTAGGAPANVAVAGARLGARTALISAVGRDPFGDYLCQLLQHEGVDISALTLVDQRTTLALVARNAGGIPDFVFYRGSDTALSPAMVPEELIQRSTFLHASSMALMSEPSRSATLAALEIAARNNVLVSVDPNLRPSSWPSFDEARRTVAPLLSSADVLKLNDEEARLLANTSDLDEAMTALAGKDRLLVVTLGSDGCTWRRGAESGQLPAPRVQAVETTGAGDAFVGALLAELTGPATEFGTITAIPATTLSAAMRFACVAGALACTKVGAMTALPTRHAVEQFLLD